jgi:hypothetical protein
MTCLSNENTQHESNDASMSVLELGSGLGIVGMVFGCEILGKLLLPPSNTASSFGSIQLFLTDVPTAMPLLQHNLQQNIQIFPSHVRTSTRPLMWTLFPSDDEHDHSVVVPTSVSATPPHTTSCFEWIIGSDLLYNTQSVPALVNTMGRYLHPTRGRVLLAVRWRKPDLERLFFQQTTERFHWQWELLPPPTGINTTMCSLSWQDFGNAACDRSNQYFHSTCIAVNGNHSANRTNEKRSNNIKALCVISPDDVQAMADEEFQAWERAHIQFYLARPRDMRSKTRTGGD